MKPAVPTGPDPYTYSCIDVICCNDETHSDWASDSFLAAIPCEDHMPDSETHHHHHYPQHSADRPAVPDWCASCDPENFLSQQEIEKLNLWCTEACNDVCDDSCFQEFSDCYGCGHLPPAAPAAPAGAAGVSAGPAAPAAQHQHQHGNGNGNGSGNGNVNDTQTYSGDPSCACNYCKVPNAADDHFGTAANGPTGSLMCYEKNLCQLTPDNMAGGPLSHLRSRISKPQRSALPRNAPPQLQHMMEQAADKPHHHHLHLHHAAKPRNHCDRASVPPQDGSELIKTEADAERAALYTASRLFQPQEVISPAASQSSVSSAASHQMSRVPSVSGGSGEMSEVSGSGRPGGSPEETRCLWESCDTSCPDPMALESHLLHDHIFHPYLHELSSAGLPGSSAAASASALASSSLPSAPSAPAAAPVETINPFMCEWNSCDYKSDDIFSLLDHIHFSHGIGQPDSVPVLRDCCRPNTTAEPAETVQPVTKTHTCKWKTASGVCNRKFESEKLLSDHITTEHIPTRKSSYECCWDGCARDKPFVQRQKLLRHLHIHTNYRPFKCPHCGQGFAEAHLLQQHERTHSGVKPFHCTYPGCNKSFAAATALSVHMRVHTGEKPLICKFPGCGKRFSESSNLAKHMKVHKRREELSGVNGMKKEARETGAAAAAAAASHVKPEPGSELVGAFNSGYNYVPGVLN